MSLAGLLLALIAVAFGIVALVAIVWLGVAILAKVFKFVGIIVGHIFSFVFGVIGDAARIVGSLVLIPIFMVLIVCSVLIGRWSAASHYGRAFNAEVSAIFVSCYRIGVGRPLRLIGLKDATEGLEQRLPQVLAAAPGRDTPPKKRVGMFEGYTIVGSLQSGGSGSRLYIAEPDELKRAAFERRGLSDLDRVVIKVFSLKDGSSLPQIIRESRALDAAKKLGLVLEHGQDDGRFFYVMRYVPGDSLATITQRLHAASGQHGLDDAGFAAAMGYAADLLDTLHTYHAGGLWHKDVKPDNIIVEGSHAHLVDFGLVTPLRSAMTLTTHGTEYFRDPELVRQALRGVKVHQIDGAKFDIYAAAAVMYSVIENSFPAHGGLSQITKRCPEALRWVVRRGMAEYDQRYPNAASMLADLDAIRTAPDPFKIRPADLPSMRGAVGAPGHMAPDLPETPALDPAPVAVAAAYTPVPPPPPPPVGPRGRPKVTLTDWWTGRYAAGPVAVAPRGRAVARPPMPPRPLRPKGERLAAHEQVTRARSRAAETRRRAHERMHNRRAGLPVNARRHERSGVLGAAAAIVVFLLFIALVINLVVTNSPRGAFRSLKGPSITVNTVPTPPIPAEPVPEVGVFPASMSLDGAMLVVSDLGYPLPEGVKDNISKGVAALRASGLALFGDHVTDPKTLDDEENEHQIDLLAEARNARGTLPLDAEELTPRLRTVLSEHPELDMILWLAPNQTDHEAINYLLVAPERDARGYASRQTLDTIVEAALGLD
ncbi:MAG: hypothetical protein R3B57_14475 [Phycisphaerales bacterium]